MNVRYLPELARICHKHDVVRRLSGLQDVVHRSDSPSRPRYQSHQEPDHEKDCAHYEWQGWHCGNANTRGLYLSRECKDVYFCALIVRRRPRSALVRP